MKNIKLQRYNSTYGFVNLNNLHAEADECFGKYWKAEDDVVQINDLLKHLGREDLIVSFIEGLEEDDILVSEFNRPKEYRVYVLSADNIMTSGYDIEEWVNYQERYNSLHEDAKSFIEVCKDKGEVYSLIGFQYAYNVDECIVANDWVFITNCY